MKDPFPTTAWSALLTQSQDGDPDAKLALTHLYEAYWSPLYGYLRRKGLDPDVAGDVLQSFYVHVMEHDVLSRLDRKDGLLRAFLLASLRNFLHDHWDRERAQARRPKSPLLSLDVATEEGRYLQIPAEETPEDIFEVRWAKALASRAVKGLASREQGLGNGEAFDQLASHIFGGAQRATYQEIAASLDITVAAVKVRVHRYRKRLGRMLREEIERTVSDTSAVDAELKHLLDRLATSGGIPEPQPG